MRLHGPPTRPHSGASRGGRAGALSRVPHADGEERRHPRRARDRARRAIGPLVPDPDHGRWGRVCCPMPSPGRTLVALALCLSPAVLTGQGTALAPHVAWWPRLPLQGSLVRLVVPPPAGDSVTAVSGELAGEPLHFERFADGFQALGAVPFAARDSAAAHVVVERAGVADDTLVAM